MTMRALTTPLMAVTVAATMMALWGSMAPIATAATATAATTATATNTSATATTNEQAPIEDSKSAPQQITDTGIVLNAGETTQNIPCPSFWQVRPNPSVENSLSYVHDSGKMAISVTYISEQTGSEITSETFARVAAEQMNCTLPIASNLLEQAWSFSCEDGIEALIYGEPRNLVLLSISGRNEETETYLDKFISFLSYQASQRR